MHHHLAPRCIRERQSAYHVQYVETVWGEDPIGNVAMRVIVWP